MNAATASAPEPAAAVDANAEPSRPRLITQPDVAPVDVLKVERIDHGVQAMHDAALMRRLAAERIPLTVCPLSNLKLCVFPDLAKHNLKQLLDAGLAVTVNSDDPAYFGGYINANFTQLFAAVPALTARDAYQLAFNSFEASFAGNADKRAWEHKLKETFERFVEYD